MSKALQWFIIIGLSIAAVVGHINVLDADGWMFGLCVILQFFILWVGFRIAKKLTV
jgi:hypothetical protein